jgi:hypothetical protein
VALRDKISSALVNAHFKMIAGRKGNTKTAKQVDKEDEFEEKGKFDDKDASPRGAALLNYGPWAKKHRDMMTKHPGFKSVQKKIEGEGYSHAIAGAILAGRTRHASAAAHKSNPRLARVKG